jgi:hypothetical protein
LLITTTSLIAGVTLAQLKIEPYTPLSQHALTDESALVFSWIGRLLTPLAPSILGKRVDVKLDLKPW